MSEKIKEKFKEILEYYDNNPFLSLIPILNFIQDEEGFISEERIKEISEFLGIKENLIYETLTFYHFLSLEKKDKKTLYICKNISCLLEGAEEILEYLKENKDKLNFDFKECECIGLCDFAPAGLLDFKPLKNLSIEKVKELNEKI
ncbi:MAG: NAD(P)H-dependent oxidoreductase subunit E [candidate division WOR-3 bacterium]